MLTLIYLHKIVIIGQVITAIVFLFFLNVFIYLILKADSLWYKWFEQQWLLMKMWDNIKTNKQTKKNWNIFCFLYSAFPPFFLSQLLLPSDELVTHRLYPSGLSTTLALHHFTSQTVTTQCGDLVFSWNAEFFVFLCFLQMLCFPCIGWLDLQKSPVQWCARGAATFEKRAPKCPLGGQMRAKVPSWEPKRVLKCPLGSQNVCYSAHLRATSTLLVSKTH